MTDELNDLLVGDVIDEAVRDWGQPITLLQIDWTYDPQTGEQDIAVTSANLSEGILSRGAVNSTRGTALGERKRESILLVRSSDYGEPVVAGRRVIVDATWYEVVRVDVRPGGLLGLAIVESRAVPIASESGVAA